MLEQQSAVCKATPTPVTCLMGGAKTGRSPLSQPGGPLFGWESVSQRATANRRADDIYKVQPENQTE